jgi:hypothetical protein
MKTSLRSEEIERHTSALLTAEARRAERFPGESG